MEEQPVIRKEVMDQARINGKFESLQKKQLSRIREIRQVSKTTTSRNIKTRNQEVFRSRYIKTADQSSAC